MRLTEYTREIEALIKKDPTDPAIFENLRDLLYYWFLRTRKVRNKNHAHDLATEMAGDLFMKIIDGFRVRESWLSFISSHYYNYFRDYKEYNYKQFFNLDGDPEAVRSMAELFSGSFGLCDFNQVSYQEVSNIDFIEYLPQAIDEAIKEHARYSDKADLLNFKISLLMSLIRENEEVFRLPEQEINYIQLFKNMFKINLRNELAELSSGSSIFCETELLEKMFSLYAENRGNSESEVSEYD